MNEHKATAVFGPMIRFLRDQSGAVTIDWIVLTASMVFLGAATGYFATSGVPQVAAKVETSLETMSVATY